MKHTNLLQEATEILASCRAMGLERGPLVWTAYLEATANHYRMDFLEFKELVLAKIGGL